jgi:hypothetical protein
MGQESYEATDVFVSGTYPELTFNERLDTDLKKKVVDYLRKGAGKCLLVHGSSKTGKTVLVERWLSPDSAIWIKGDEIQHISDLYSRIVDELKLFTVVSETDSKSETIGAGGGIEGGLPGIKFRMNADAGVEHGTADTRSRNSLSVSVVKAAIKAKPVPIVIDDFHFMDSSLRLDVAKAVKDLIRSTRVVLIAIPHSTFEPLRKLPDMDWRVETLEVKRWEPKELAQIAHDGFGYLGLVDHADKIGARLATESRGAPAIMQTLCLEYATEVLNVWSTARPSVDAKAPQDWAQFLRSVAEGKKPIAFDAFVDGKDVRGTDRAERKLRTGEVTDIYGAVLYTLSKMSAFGSLTKNQVADRMQELVEDAPSASTISGNLTHLAEIAEKVRGHGDPALTYQDPELQILDPFLSFFLAHGDWEVPKPRKKRGEATR